ADGWSMGVLLRELATLYARASPSPAVPSPPAPLPPLPVQYADFACWQRGWLVGEALQAEIDFWRRQLAGAPAVLRLPADRPRPAAPSFRGRSLPIVLPAPLARSLHALSRRAGATLFMTLLAAFQGLLSRLAGQRDVVVGSPISG